MKPAPPSFPAPPVCRLVARVHRERRSGIVEVEVGEEARRLVFAGGDLFLAAEHPLARALAPLLPVGSPRRGTPGGAAEIRGVMARIAFGIRAWEGASRFIAAEGEADGMVGPLPTRLLLMEWAAARSVDELTAILGGGQAELVAIEPEDEREVTAGRLLDPQAAVLRSRLSHPTRVDDVLRQSGGSPVRVLADLVRLRTAGLIGPPAPVAPAAPAPVAVAPSIAPDLLRRHAERVGRDLAIRPLALDVESHRSRLEELSALVAAGLPRMILGVDRGGPASEVEAAYSRLARLTHPGHAGRLGLAADDQRLWRLFERVVASYHDLSRSPGTGEDEETRPESVATPPAGGARQLARSYYERAEALIEAEDFHFAIELLKQAVSSHPRPEYYVLLGRVQAKNPNWLRHAVDSYRRALDLGADDGRVSVALGRLCEEMEQLDEAERHYRAALARDPHAAEARAGLARVAGARSRGGSLSGLFGRRTD